MSKKLQEKQERRAAEERRRQAQRKAARRGNLVTVGVVLIVIAVVGAFIVPELLERGAAVGVEEGAAGCTPIETHPDEGAQHVEPGTEVAYDTSPPTSGNHYPSPADPGFYTSPVPAETLVHNLEHGQIVFWYRPGAPQEVLDALESIAEQERAATLVVPYTEVPEGYSFTMTAWGASQSCERVSQEVVDAFRSRFQGRGPEQVGVPTFEG